MEGKRATVIIPDHLIISITGSKRKITISQECDWECGGKTGFSFMGGVLAKEDAIKLANFILDKTKEK